MKKGKYFKLFACCKAVEGINRSAIYDLQRNEIHFIPNSLYSIVVEELNQPVLSILSEYKPENQDIIIEYLDFLEEKELGFYTNNPEQFPDMDNNWESPYLITNAIIDVNDKSGHDFKNIFDQLDELGCQAIQLRFFDSISKKKLTEILSFTSQLRFRSIEVFLNTSNDWNSIQKIGHFLEDFKNVSHFFVFECKEEKFIENEFGVLLYFITKSLKLDDCGQIDPKYFTVTIPFYTESQKYNSCLNRKISIDWNGNIMNCPSMKKSYGNIKTNSLKETAKSSEFQSVWQINKDKIEICKSCEFRYACSDCRAYLNKPEDLYSKPAKCKYNPENP